MGKAIDLPVNLPLPAPNAMRQIPCKSLPARHPRLDSSMRKWVWGESTKDRPRGRFIFRRGKRGCKSTWKASSRACRLLMILAMSQICSITRAVSSIAAAAASTLVAGLGASALDVACSMVSSRSECQNQAERCFSSITWAQPLGRFGANIVKMRGWRREVRRQGHNAVIFCRFWQAFGKLAAPSNAAGNADNRNAFGLKAMARKDNPARRQAACPL